MHMALEDAVIQVFQDRAPACYMQIYRMRKHREGQEIAGQAIHSEFNKERSTLHQNESPASSLRLGDCISTGSWLITGRIENLRSGLLAVIAPTYIHVHPGETIAAPRRAMRD